ncbi:MAG: hypothetical protein KDI46_06525 [Alphaproteobacteria bacterium]|nr:hypothetical protein [Alphaproteobacteria bacterium]
MPSEILVAILSSLGTTSLIGIAGFFLKDWIITRLTKSIQHEYDKKLEGIKSDFRSRETEIADVRKAAISNAMISQSALDQKRLDAIDCLWEGFMDVRKNILAPTILSRINSEEVSKDINNPNTKLFIESLTKTINIEKPESILGEATKKAQAARPWIGKRLWELYSAYSGLIMLCVLTLVALKTINNDPLKFIDRKKSIEEVRKALPDLNIDWENLNDAVIPILLDLLETLILKEIDHFISGEAADLEANNRAMKISKQIEILNKTSNAQEKTQ